MLEAGQQDIGSPFYGFVLSSSRKNLTTKKWGSYHRIIESYHPSYSFEKFLSQAPARDAGHDNETPSEGLALLPGNL